MDGWMDEGRVDGLEERDTQKQTEAEPGPKAWA